jgi:hypothetical protein
MTDKQRVDPSLSDIFQTALSRAQPETRPEPRNNVVVNGHSNVVSFGGTVHIQETRGARDDSDAQKLKGVADGADQVQ